MGLSKQYTGGFAAGFLFYAAFTAIVLGCLALWSRKWVGVWVGPAARCWPRPGPRFRRCRRARSAASSAPELEHVTIALQS